MRRYRFFSTASISQNRYYYLSSVGVMLLFAMVLGLMWDSGRKALRILCAAVVVVFIAGSIVRVHRIEKIWSDQTEMYRQTVSFTVAAVDDSGGITTAAISDPPLAFPYISDAVSLYRPDWNILEVNDVDEARPHAPCVYIPFLSRDGRLESGEVQVLR